LKTLAYFTTGKCLHHANFSLDEVSILAIGVQVLRGLNMETALVDSIERMGEFLFLSTVEMLSVNKHLLVTNIRRKHTISGSIEVVCNKATFDELTMVADPTLILGLALAGSIVSSITKEALITDSTKYVAVYEKHIRNIDIGIKADEEMRIRTVLDNNIHEFLGDFTPKMKSRLGEITSNLNGRDVNMAIFRIVNAMSSEDLKSIKKVIEKVYLELYFKNTPFERFYKRVNMLGGEDMEVSVSSSLFYMCCELVLREV
jgi:hypothetical protein